MMSSIQSAFDKNFEICAGRQNDRLVINYTHTHTHIHTHTYKHTHVQTHTNTHTHTHIYIYVCMCVFVHPLVCLSVCLPICLSVSVSNIWPHTRTHKHTNSYMYMCVCVCVWSYTLISKELNWQVGTETGRKTNGLTKERESWWREPKSCLGRVFNYKLVCFAP
jgi:hypothetical protein